MTATSALDDLNRYCDEHRCETCPMNEVTPPAGLADLCVVSLAIEALEAREKTEVAS